MRSREMVIGNAWELVPKFKNATLLNYSFRL